VVCGPCGAAGSSPRALRLQSHSIIIRTSLQSPSRRDQCELVSHFQFVERVQVLEVVSTDRAPNRRRTQSSGAPKYLLIGRAWSGYHGELPDVLALQLFQRNHRIGVAAADADGLLRGNSCGARAVVGGAEHRLPGPLASRHNPGVSATARRAPNPLRTNAIRHGDVADSRLDAAAAPRGWRDRRRIAGLRPSACPSSRARFPQRLARIDQLGAGVEPIVRTGFAEPRGR